MIRALVVKLYALLTWYYDLKLNLTSLLLRIIPSRFDGLTRRLQRSHALAYLNGLRGFLFSNLQRIRFHTVRELEHEMSLSGLPDELQSDICLYIQQLQLGRFDKPLLRKIDRDFYLFQLNRERLIRCVIDQASMGQST